MGPKSTMNTVGKMQAMSGKSIFTGASFASFSARCVRSMRSCVDWMRRILPRLVPIRSAWMSALTNDVSDGSDTLTFLDPKSLGFAKTLRVMDAGRPVGNLNELE